MVKNAYLNIVRDCWSNFCLKKKQINLTLVILGKSFCSSDFLYELVLNIE